MAFVLFVIVTTIVAAAASVAANGAVTARIAALTVIANVILSLRSIGASGRLHRILQTPVSPAGR